MCFSVYINDASSEKCGEKICNSLQRCCAYNKEDNQQEGIQKEYYECVAKCPSGCNACPTKKLKNDVITSSLNVLEINNINTRNNSNNCINRQTGKKQCCESTIKDGCYVANLVNIEGRKCNEKDFTNCSEAKTDSNGFCQCTKCINDCYHLTKVNKSFNCVSKTIKINFYLHLFSLHIIDSINIKYNELQSKINPPTRTGYDFDGYYYIIGNLLYNNSGDLVDNEGFWKYVIKNYCSKTEPQPQSVFAHWKAKTYECSAGQYLSAATGICETCTKGSYCPGVRGCHSNEKCKADVKEIEENGQKKKVFEYETGKDKGIIACPEGSTGSDSGASSEDNCYSYCSDNNWLPANSRVCEECPTGYYCTGGKFYKQNDNQGIKTCPDGEAVPYIDSSNDYIKKATFLNKYGNCQHCSEQYDQEHKEDTNKIILTQLVGDNIWFEHINNGETNFSYTSSSIINTRTATKEEIINNKDNKYRNNYCKRNTNDLNSVIKCTEDGRASCVIKGKLKVPFPGDENNFLELAEPCRYTPDSNYD